MAESYDLSQPNYDYILPVVMEAIEPAVTNSSSSPSVEILELGSGTGIFGESLSRYVLSSSSSEAATPNSAFSLRPSTSSRERRAGPRVIYKDAHKVC